MSIQAMWSFANNILRDSRALLTEQLKEFGLTPAEGTILLHLHLHGDALIQDRLAENLEVSKPAISKSLDSLEEKGFIVRRQDPTNRRTNLVILTDKAKQVAGGVERVFKNLHDAAAEGISEEDIQLLRTLAERVAANLRKYRQLSQGT